MRPDRHSLSLGVILLAALVARVSSDGPQAGQAPASPSVVTTGGAGPAGAGTPDLGGVWMPPYVPDMSVDGRNQRGYAEPPFSTTDTPQMRQARYAKGSRADLPFTPAGLADWSSYDPATGDYTGSCFPFGLMRSMNAPYPFQIVQDTRHVTFLFEINNWHHVVRLNEPRPANPEPTWYGHSVGRWEGETLVVETTGFNGYTRLDTVGHPHSDQLHMTQTFRRVDETHLAYTVRIEDPKTYTKAWTNERVFTRIAGPLIEYSCEENNKSLWDGRITAWTPPWARK